MKKGVVVDCNDDFITLLTPEGQFLKANNKKGMYELGEEITFFPLINEREEAATRESRLLKNKVINALSFKKTRIGAITFLAIMFLIISFLPYVNQNKTYAYMSIDINPSFEVKISDDLTVLSLDPINEEAEKLILLLPNWQDKPFTDVVNSIVQQSKSEGYMYPGKEILIATVVNQEDKEIEEKLEENMDQIRHSIEEDDMVVKTIETDTETRDKAKKQGISTGKYLELTNDEEVQEVENVTVPEIIEHEDKSSSEKDNQNLIIPVKPNVETNSKWKTDTKEELKETQDKLKEKARSEEKKVIKKELDKKNEDNSKKGKNKEKQERKLEREREREREKEERKLARERQKEEKRENKQMRRSENHKHQKSHNHERDREDD
ncbi:anti-sigma factor domain-containing protein [Metabacillus litoralis]|uniref:anti-sigma factor domain-containing protein n=1 Tax=Metabacillus litoralis TaxID=152268 RepID=UPI001CFF3F3B|nr:anti-sigma factor domain-containing protein [Metabacillus litoralis]